MKHLPVRLKIIIVVVLAAVGCNLPNDADDDIHVDDTSSIGSSASTDDDSSADSSDGTDTSGGCVEADTGTDMQPDTADTTDTQSDGAESDTAPDTAKADTETADSETADSETVAPDSNFVPPDTDLCPVDMVAVAPITDSSGKARFCIDRYEASRQDATTESHGNDDSIAMSVPNVLPWYVRPMTDTALSDFENACNAAGKFLCTAEQWAYSCSGPELTSYVYGDAFDVEVCNNVATYCDDYCEENGVAAEDCNTSISNCGYYCGDGSQSQTCFRVAPTGQFSRCTNDIGTYDINGNLWEIVTSETATSGYEIRGGAFNCASPSSRLQCTYAAGWTDLYAGFRCCKDIYPP